MKRHVNDFDGFNRLAESASVPAGGRISLTEFGAIINSCQTVWVNVPDDSGEGYEWEERRAKIERQSWSFGQTVALEVSFIRGGIELRRDRNGFSVDWALGGPLLTITNVPDWPEIKIALGRVDGFRPGDAKMLAENPVTLDVLVYILDNASEYDMDLDTIDDIKRVFGDVSWIPEGHRLWKIVHGALMFGM